MAILIGTLGFIVLLIIAVLYGCWWLIPTAGIVAIVWAAGYYSWRWAGTIGATPGGANAWWAANRERIVRAVLIFAILLGLGVLIYALVHRFAPTCTSGCLSSVSAPVGRISDTTRYEVITPSHPVEARMPRDFRMDANLDETRGDQYKIESRIVWEDQTKIQIFTVKPGVEAVPIRIRIYRCTAEAPCNTTGEMPIPPSGV